MLNRIVLLIGLFLGPSAKSEYFDEREFWTYCAEKSLVEVSAEGNLGNGVRIEDGKTIITCAHVVGDKKWVLLNKKWDALVITADKRLDIAILRTDSPGLPMKMVWGFQEGNIGTGVVVAGKLHNQKLEIQRATVLNHMYGGNPVVNALPKKGFSGGPVFTPEGLLIGIIRGFAIYDEKEWTEVIPISLIRKIIDETREKFNKRI